MEIQIDAASRQPIYRQVMVQIREAVARGRMQPGQRLPSVRELSSRLVVNPNTVARGYRELEQEGLLNTRAGKGVYVAEPKSDLTKRARMKRFQTLLDEFLTEAVHLGLTGDEVVSAVTTRAEGFEWQTR